MWQNYWSKITLHPEVIDGRPGTLVLESYVVDIPEGNTKDETHYFIEAFIKCHLKSLADVSEKLGFPYHRELLERWYFVGRFCWQVNSKGFGCSHKETLEGEKGILCFACFNIVASYISNQILILAMSSIRDAFNCYRPLFKWAFWPLMTIGMYRFIFNKCEYINRF